MNSKKVIVICGATATGKTSAAIELAQRLKTEIISADSRQCYKELNIGVARPTPEQLSAVKHHFIASHSISEEVNAAVFEEYALNISTDLFSKYDTIIMVGGTGLYIKAFLEGLDAIPEVSPDLRGSIIASFEKHGLGWLQQQVQQQDPAFYSSGEIQNPQRLMRALEVKLSTGESITQFRKGVKAKRDFDVVKYGLELPREELYRNINVRVDQMMQQGLLEEVRSLIPYKHLNALQTVGYSELFNHLEGKITLEEAIEEIKKHTRNYAKRQGTWFKKDDSIKWGRRIDD